jgi:nicotinamidase-related amidase
MPRSALVIIDMINPFDFPGGARLARAATALAPTIARLKSRMSSRGFPCIYANDNFGKWQSDLAALLERARAGRGGAVVDALHPDDRDYLVIKPRHSAFYQTNLQFLLEELEVRRLVLAGLAAESCVLLTALDAHMRGFKVHAPSNCTAGSTAARKAAALTVLRSSDIDTVRLAVA